MATSYPAALDSLTNPSSGDSQDSATVPHATQHANENDAIEAIEATLGINPQGASASVKARLDAIEASVTALGISVGSAVADNSITNAKLVNATITGAKIAANTITENHLMSTIVSTGKIADGAITGVKLATDAITYDKVADSSKAVFKRVADQIIDPGPWNDFISWDVEASDTDGFGAVPTTSLAIPTGKAGLYLIVVSVNATPVNAGNYLSLEPTGGYNWKQSLSSGFAVSVALCDLAVGNTVRAMVHNEGTGSLTVTGRIAMVKLFDA